MIKNTLVRILFLIAAAYDGVLGLVFLCWPKIPFDSFEVEPPNHMAYVQFTAALLLIFALMFVRVALRPATNRHLIVYGILLKVAFCGVAFSYWATEGIPMIWKPFAVTDLVMGVLFVWAWSATKPE